MEVWKWKVGRDVSSDIYDYNYCCFNTVIMTVDTITLSSKYMYFYAKFSFYKRVTTYLRIMCQRPSWRKVPLLKHFNKQLYSRNCNNRYFGIIDTRKTHTVLRKSVNAIILMLRNCHRYPNQNFSDTFSENKWSIMSFIYVLRIKAKVHLILKVKKF